MCPFVCLGLSGNKERKEIEKKVREGGRDVSACVLHTCVYD